MNTQVFKMACVMALVMTAGAASADIYYRFVPNTGNWWSKIPIPSGVKTTTYASLQAAVSAARAGDTVWVQDGFVCNTGYTDINTTKTTGKARIKPYNAAFTLRSESGYVDEANGKGATIRGEKVAVGNYDNNNVRPICSQNAGMVIQGFVLENGATGSHATYGLGGAVYGAAIVSNCVIRNCMAYAGGAFGLSRTATKCVTVYNTVISNCQALAKDTATTKYGGGAVYGAGSFVNCILANNTSASYGGAVSDENTKGIASTYSGCVISGNEALQGGGAHVATNASHVTTFTNCRIQDNEATVSGAGGVGGRATLIDCTVSGNKSANGAAAYSATTAGSCYNCLFGDNVSAGGVVVEGNATTPLSLYNCTVAGNSSPAASCVKGVTFENSIVWGNAHGGSELSDCTATYTCQKDLAEGTGNTNEDPKLSSDYRLTVRNKCVDAARTESWMTTAGDARAFDAAGYPRIRGTAPDMGCYERESPGSLVIGR